MNQWQIIFEGELTPPVRFGVEAVSAAIHEYARYWPHVGPEDAAFSGVRLALAAPEDHVPAHGYRIAVEAPRDGRQLARIFGADDVALMHGCMEFCGRYLGQARLARRTANPYYFNPLFTEAPLPQTDYTSAPAIQRRGLWTWGMSVYDWRGYLENMARLRLNEVIIWNDFAPLNGREIVERAHSLGIGVIWGYAWGWDTTMRLDVSDEAVERIIATYEREYAPLGGDGIYFQSFTETGSETLDGRLIAEAVTEFVNRTAGRLLEKHPGLRLQFGLHAASVKNRLAYIAQVDPRVEIIWENCGDFPYHSLPDHTDAPEETRAFTEKIITLRPEGVAGAVLKSMVQLDWGRFQHQTGPAMLGCGSEAEIEARLPLFRQIWRYVAGEWLAHGEKCLETARQFAANDGAAVYNLVDDGLFEREIPLPVALFAECLWDPAREWRDILRETVQRPDIAMI
ncbi:MAG: hypothetical protein IKO07_01765 [Clostridia bacterium]|nr:hypothetical protein [Clostridia bacterium]